LRYEAGAHGDHRTHADHRRPPRRPPRHPSRRHLRRRQQPPPLSTSLERGDPHRPVRPRRRRLAPGPYARPRRPAPRGRRRGRRGPAHDLRSDPRGDAARSSVTPKLAAADAFVVLTPEYNHSYPAGLKNLIDWHFTEWQAKPVGLVSYGGVSGGLRAVEHLRQVFAEVHAVTLRDTVSFHNAGASFDEGRLKDPTAPDAAARVMLDQLVWWGRGLREARERRPYGA